MTSQKRDFYRDSDKHGPSQECCMKTPHSFRSCVAGEISVGVLYCTGEGAARQETSQFPRGFTPLFAWRLRCQESTPGTRIPPATQVRLYSGGTGSQSTQSHYVRWPILTGNTVTLIFVSTVYFGIYYCYILEKEPCNVWWLCLILIIATKNLLKPKSHSVI